MDVFTACLKRPAARVPGHPRQLRQLRQLRQTRDNYAIPRTCSSGLGTADSQRVDPERGLADPDGHGLAFLAADTDARIQF